ncbi:MAG: hypothetical protein HYU28_03465 [Actinobacteria bacterium]|nr:hypothetical protein [Actinomycetota bacterium]
MPVLEDYPEVIADEAGAPLACPLPPRIDASAHPAIDEVLALRPAWDRTRSATGRTMVGRVVDADGVAEAVSAFARVVDGTPWEEAGFPAPPNEVALDVRAYYEESALALVDHVPAARAAEAWLYRETETGRLLHRAQAALRDAGAPFPVWFYVVPVSQQGASPG